jgi:hypothetical protein
MVTYSNMIQKIINNMDIFEDILVDDEQQGK